MFSVLVLSFTLVLPLSIAFNTIEVFRRPIEVEYFFPASGHQDDAINVAVMYVPDGAGSPTCEILTAAGVAHTATVAALTPLLQIVVPASLDLDDPQAVSVVLDYGDGGSVSFDWEFVPDTAPSVFLVTPPSQFTYGGIEASIAMTNSDFDMTDPPVVFIGGTEAPVINVEKQEGTETSMVIFTRVPPLRDGCEVGATSCSVEGSVTHSTFNAPVGFSYEYVVPATPTVASLTQSPGYPLSCSRKCRGDLGSSFGGDYVAATLLDFPPVSEAALVVIKFGPLFVTASGVQTNADGSLGVTFTTPPFSGGAGLSTVKFARADVPGLSAIVEFEYFDAKAVRILDDPSPSIGSNLGGTESSMSFENFAVLSELELVQDAADIYGFQCLEEFGRVTSVIKSVREELRVNVVIPASPTGSTTCYFFRKDEVDKRAAVDFEFEDAGVE